MEQLNYYNLEKIISLCVSGDIDMHEPIEVTNKLKNQKVKMSVLKHLLLLCQADKTSLIHILSIIRCQIKSKLLELINDNSFIKHYVQNVIQEWRLNISPIDLFIDGLEQCEYSEGDDLFNYQSLVDEIECSQRGGSHLDVLEKALKQRQQSFSPLTQDYANQIQDKIKGLYSDCNECVGRVKGYSADTMQKQKMINPLHIDILIDLSSKSKPIYLEFSNSFKDDENETFSTFLQESQDLLIPDNIHTIFLNYVISINMLKKEMNYINHSFKGILSFMQPKMIMLTKMMDGLNELDVHPIEDLDSSFDLDGLQQDIVITEDMTPLNENSVKESSGFGFSFF